MDAVVALARSLGLRVDAPVVLDAGMNHIVRLDPSPAVARVTRFAHLVLDVDHFAGSIGLARHVGELAVPPSTLVDPGPHALADGRYVTFWEPAERQGVLAPCEVGTALHALHEAARDYDGPLRHYDPRPFALRVDEVVGVPVLRAAVECLELPDLPMQPLHGDAHHGNVLPGPRWIDFDEACVGPREWDLAALRHRTVVLGERAEESAASFDAYGDVDEDAVRACDSLVALFIAAWGVLTVPDHPRTRARLQWLRDRAIG